MCFKPSRINRVDFLFTHNLTYVLMQSITFSYAAKSFHNAKNLSYMVINHANMLLKIQ